MKRAIFLDRDGVINKLVFNRKSKEYGAPLHKRDLKLYPWAPKILRKFKDMGYLLFLVSNQPDHAKGYTSLKNLKGVATELIRYLGRKGVNFNTCFYCFHHPQAKVAEYRLECACRKPKPYFALKAKKKYGLDMHNSWFIGDSDSDVFCGKACGLATILINERHSRHKRGKSSADFTASDLRGALKIIKEGS